MWARPRRTPPPSTSTGINWAFRARGGVLLPILGLSYGEALERGEIELRYDPDEGSFSAWYFEHRLPIAPERYGEILRVIVKEADAAETSRRRRLSLATRYTGLRRPNRKEAPGFKTELKESRAPPTSSAAALPSIAPARTARRRR